MSLKRLSPQDLPPGIRTSATHIADGGRLYTFSHVTLGQLGRLRVVPHGPTQIEASAEVAPGDPDAPDWVEKFHRTVNRRSRSFAANAAAKAYDGHDREPAGTAEGAVDSWVISSSR